MGPNLKLHGNSTSPQILIAHTNTQSAPLWRRNTARTCCVTCVEIWRKAVRTRKSPPILMPPFAILTSFRRRHGLPPSPVTEGAARDAIHIIPADSIDMTFARGMDEHFWDPRGDATRERFMDAASHIPEVQTALSQGVPLNELINDPKLGGCASIYFDPKNVIGVHRNEHGGYEYGDNGRHRIMAAAEMDTTSPCGLSRTVIGDLNERKAPIRAANAVVAPE